MDISFIIYLTGAVLGFRYHVGAFLAWSKAEWGYLETPDYFFGFLIGAVTMWGWPLTLAGRLVYIGVKKSGLAEHHGVTEFLFPAPKPIETKAERQARKSREQQEHHESVMRMERVKTLQARERTNILEEENGLPLTVWKD